MFMDLHTNRVNPWGSMGTWMGDKILSWQGSETGMGNIFEGGD